MVDKRRDFKNIDTKQWLQNYSVSQEHERNKSIQLEDVPQLLSLIHVPEREKRKNNVNI